MPTYEITAGSISAVVSDRGAELMSVLVPDAAGDQQDVVRSGEAYAGAVCGRFANRISGSRFELDGKPYELSTNEGPNHLHGGRHGFDVKQWSAQAFATDTRSGVHMSLVSPDGDEGYPGELSVRATYWVDSSNALGIEFEATTNAPTVLNLTNHAYWNLGGPQAEDVEGHRLEVGATKYLVVDNGLIPTGHLGTATGEFFAEYDTCFILDSPVAAVLTDPISGRRMEIVTDHPALQVYTANHVGHMGVALEAQGYPDAPNRHEFPSCVLRPGEIYRRETIHRFSTL
jgi:aldose 1-epimerase